MFNEYLDSIDFDAITTDNTELSATDWLRREVEEDRDHCFVCVDENHYAAVSRKKNALFHVDVSIDNDGFVFVKTDTGIPVTEETELPFRTYQMAMNGSFKTMGFAPATAGENITFEVHIRPHDNLNLSDIIDRCLHSCSHEASAFEMILGGKTVKETYEEVRADSIRTAMRLRSLLG